MKRNKNKTNNHLVNNSKSYLLYGKHSAVAALNNPRRKIINIYVLEEFFTKNQYMLAKHNVQIVNNDFLKKIIQSNEKINCQGIVVEVMPLETLNIENMIEKHSTHDRIIILDHITNPQNAGAIIRSAVAFNFFKIIILSD